MSAKIPQPEPTRFLTLTVTPAGEQWLKAAQAFLKVQKPLGIDPAADVELRQENQRLRDYDQVAFKMGTVPALVRANGDLVLVFLPRPDVHDTDEVLVGEGVVARHVDRMPHLEVGDEWLFQGEGVAPRPYGRPLPVHVPVGLPDPTPGKRISADGHAILDEWESNIIGKRPSGKTTRKLAVLAYRLGQAAGVGEVPPLVARVKLSSACPPDAPAVNDILDSIPGPREVWKPLFPAGIDALLGVFEAGYRSPRKPYDDIPPAKRPRAWKLGDDAELGQDLAVKLGGRTANRKLADGEPLTAVFDRGVVHKVDAHGVWQVVEHHLLLQAAAGYSGTWISTPTEKDPCAVQPVKLSKTRIVAIPDVACEVHLRVPRFFDDAPRGVACKNAFLPIVGDAVGEPVPLVPEHRVRASQVLPVSYDPEAMCPEFIRFLNDLFPNLPQAEVQGRVDCVLQFFGAALLGLGPKYGKALILTGAGNNGKSTLLEIMSSLFPVEGQVAIPIQALHEDYKAAMLANAQINICNELPGRELLSSEAVKAIVTGQRINARSPYEKPFSFEPRTAHAFACNRLPATKDITPGFFRRFIVIDFPADFTGREDRGLKRRIVSKELPGILALTLHGAMRLTFQNHYTIPESARKAEETWKQNSDSVTMWLHEATEPDGWTGTTAAFVAYKIWSERTGMKPVSQREFSLRLEGAKVPEKNPKNSRYWNLTPKRDESVFADVEPLVFS